MSDEDFGWLEDEYPDVYDLLRAIGGNDEALERLRDEAQAFELVARAATGDAGAVRDAREFLREDDDRDWLDGLFAAIRDEGLYEGLSPDGDSGLIGLFFAAVRDELDDPRRLQRRGPHLARLADLLKDEFTLYPDDEDDFDDPDDLDDDDDGDDDEEGGDDESEVIEEQVAVPSAADQIAAWNFALGLLAFRRGDTLNALDRLTRSIAAGPSTPAFRKRAEAHRTLGNETDASLDEERAEAASMKTVPDVGDRPMDQAFVYGSLRLMLGEYEKAIEHLTQSLEAVPTAEAYMDRGEAYRGCGRAGEAAEDEQRAEEMLLATLRQVAERCCHQGDLLASIDDGQFHEGAVSQYTLAIAADPSPDVHRRRAEVYRKLGQLDRAAEDDRAAGALVGPQ